MERPRQGRAARQREGDRVASHGDDQTGPGRLEHAVLFPRRVHQQDVRVAGGERGGPSAVDGGDHHRHRGAAQFHASDPGAFYLTPVSIRPRRRGERRSLRTFPV
eukprot:16369-Pelagococcus_subviridis.AAC.1